MSPKSRVTCATTLKVDVVQLHHLVMAPASTAHLASRPCRSVEGAERPTITCIRSVCLHIRVLAVVGSGITPLA